MTYKIVALQRGVTPKQVYGWPKSAEQDISEELQEVDELVDDMVFDRERLSFWCGTTQSDWVNPDDNFARVLTKTHVDRAIAILQGLLDKVESMPFTKGADAYSEKSWDLQTDKWKYEYFGDPVNIEIVKEVDKVFSRSYHFTFPWESDDWKTDNRAADMIRALKRVRRFMEENPDRAVVALYY